MDKIGPHRPDPGTLDGRIEVLCIIGNCENKYIFTKSELG
jgi:hypothetical protein